MKRTTSWFDLYVSAEMAQARKAVVAQFFFDQRPARTRVESNGAVLDRALGDRQRYGHVGGISMGEERARQVTTDDSPMAWNRRVDVYSSSRIFEWPDLRLDRAHTPGTFRIARMEWIKADFNGAKFGRTSIKEVFSEHLAGVVSSLTTNVRYTWGAATPTITVHLSRDSAERSPFFFPQNSWRPMRGGR